MEFRITVLPGDGIGPEVTQQAVRILRALNDGGTYDFRFQEALIGGVAVLQHGSPLPRATLDACLQADAVLLGAVGGPSFDGLPAEKRPETGLLQLRRALGGFANLRPAKAILPERTPFRPEVVSGADLLIVRELLGGLYFGEPRGWNETSPEEAFNTMRYSEEEVDRVARIAFQAAQRRRRKVTSVDKANVLETSRLWRKVVSRVAKDFPDVKLEHVYVDACAMYLNMDPKRFDVILTENLFGDILSDQAASLSGSLGLLPSAAIGGEVDLYEPIHGSAPDIAGTGRANPLGAILSAAMLLRYSAGMEAEAEWIERSVESVLKSGVRTCDIASPGSHWVTTEEMGDLVESKLTDLLRMQHSYHAV